MIPKIFTKTGENIGVDVFVQFPDLSDQATTFISSDEASGQTTISVDAGTKFANNDYVVIGEIGTERAEIRKVSGSASGTITTDALVYAHPRGDVVRFIPYNQLTITRSTDGGTNFTPLSAVSIDPQLLSTVVHRTSDAATDVYKVRFYNSTTTLYSSYSDQTLASGYDSNSVFAIKKRALTDLGETISDSITEDFLNESLWEARREIDEDPRILRWPFRMQNNSSLGKIVPGTYTVSIPTDLKNPKTNENILNVRIGTREYPLRYIGLNKMRELYSGVSHTTIGSIVSDSDVTITLTNSGDFDTTGSISVAASSVSGTIDSISYTANNKSTNVISGVTGIATGGHAASTDVWQNASFGEPTYYTVDSENSKIMFDIPFSDDLAGYNIYADYYSVLPAYNSDADELDEPEYDLFVFYLKWKIKSRLSGGKISPTGENADPDYQFWIKKKEDFITKQHLGQEIYLVPSELSD